ncbi:TPA: DUF1642 domain-containing protein [Streptococcus pyogenes]|nr:DUF1642 domain-containing protein [Streptococcus pyogenes]HER3876560.1 DUF1642 domain-containing protein [Streptococcus pyogenes]
MLMLEKISAEVRRKGKNYTKGYEKGIDLAIKLIEASDDEPQKPVIPQYIADFIAEQKEHGLSLSYSIDASMSDGVAEWYWDNPELFVRAWLDGYDVEKEKRYLVKMKNIQKSYNYLNYSKDKKMWVFSTKENLDFSKSYHTRKELEDAGFGWVFDCEGVEIEGVE